MATWPALPPQVKGDGVGGMTVLALLCLPLPSKVGSGPGQRPPHFGPAIGPCRWLSPCVCPLRLPGRHGRHCGRHRGRRRGPSWILMALLNHSEHGAVPHCPSRASAERFELGPKPLSWAFCDVTPCPLSILCSPPSSRKSCPSRGRGPGEERDLQTPQLRRGQGEKSWG